MIIIPGIFLNRKVMIGDQARSFIMQLLHLISGTC